MAREPPASLPATRFQSLPDAARRAGENVAFLPLTTINKEREQNERVN